MLHFFCFFVARRFIDHLLCFVAFCGVLWRFVAFSGVCFVAFSGALAISFCCGTKYLGGLKSPPLFWSVKIENGGAAAPFPP